MASCDAQGAECRFFLAPLPPGIFYRAFQHRAQRAAMQELCRQMRQLSAFTPKYRLLPQEKMLAKKPVPFSSLAPKPINL